jgi:hypothetical protein
MSISSKIFASTKQKLEAKGSSRPDMALADYRMLDDSHADILVAYSTSIPTVKEMANFVMAKFEGKAFPLVESARCYEEIKCVGMTVIPPQITRAKEDSSKLMKITASTFLDTVDKSEWKMEKNPTTGVSYLARALVENFESIIRAKKQRIGSNLSVTASCNFNKITASYLSANEDDYVKFFDGVMRVGTVKSVEPDGNTVKIMDDEGEVFVVDRTCITEVIRKDDDEMQKITENMESFYEHIFPESFVKDLFKHGPKV